MKIDWQMFKILIGESRTFGFENVVPITPTNNLVFEIVEQQSTRRKTKTAKVFPKGNDHNRSVLRLFSEQYKGKSTKIQPENVLCNAVLEGEQNEEKCKYMFRRSQEGIVGG